ncbi:hypothetical protein [Xenorhabdus beddingii]|uniref:hypothetical protein n=1 Tax=Xenorhabdus beddingii TaxID=40578 RepID=UPI000A328CD0|nr:hypothetical protein [Xenorhabdus beddingii]
MSNEDHHEEAALNRGLFHTLTKRNQTHTAPFAHQITDHLRLIWITLLRRAHVAQSSPRNKRKPDVGLTAIGKLKSIESVNIFSLTEKNFTFS